MERKAFLDQEPPPGYVAGVGRGATGFTTSADTAPVRFESNFGTEDADGDEHGMLAVKRRTDDDDEADEIYEAIEKRLERRRKKREASEEAETGVVKIETGNGTITSKFLLLKLQLALVSALEWLSLPEVGDLTRRNKRQRILEQQLQRTYAAPDTLVAGSDRGFRGTANEKNENTDSLLEELEADAVQRVDMERSRQILASLRKTEPGKADLWIASARLEAQAKNFEAAKKLIVEGCNRVPHSEQVWLESIKIHRKSSESTKLCKFIVNEALRLNSSSEALWFQAAELENPADLLSRRKIFMKALEFLPSSSKLWKALIDLETDDEDVKRLLQKATQLCPEDWSLWLALLKLSSYTDSKKVLNSARKQLPKNPHVWVAALQLEERENANISEQKLHKMLLKGFDELTKHEYSHEVEFWLEQAVEAEKNGFPQTAKAIVGNVFRLVSQNESRINELFQLADKLSRLEAPSCAIHAYDLLTQENPNNISCWTRLFAMLRDGEKEDKQSLLQFYEKAISSNPGTEVLRLMYAKDAWVACSDIPLARTILEKADDDFPRSEKIYLARLKLEVSQKNYEIAYEVAAKCLKDAPDVSVRLWYKYIHLLRFCQFKLLPFAKQISLTELCDEALSNFPENPKLYLQKAQILEELEEVQSARETLSIGFRKCPESAELAIYLAKLDIKLGAVSRARSLLDTAILKNPKSASLWAAKVQLELDQGDMVSARQLTNRGRQQFPSAASIWLQYLKMIPKMSHRKNAFLDALKETSNSPEILLGIGVFFWIDGLIAKAKAWFDRALNADKYNGDAWGWSYSFFDRQGLESDKESLIAKLTPHFEKINKGETWIRIAKDYKNFEKGPSEIVQLVAEALLTTTVAS